jgi:hypothetical protein
MVPAAAFIGKSAGSADTQRQDSCHNHQSAFLQHHSLLFKIFSV